MTVKTQPQEELVVSKGKDAMVGNGVAVAEAEPTTELGVELSELKASCMAKLDAATRKYKAQYAEIEARARKAPAGDAQTLTTEVRTSHVGVPNFQWWNLIVLGPFQKLAPGGPFRPSKIIRAGEPAYMVYALWRNPLSLPGAASNPSPAEIMASFRYGIRGEMINLSLVQDGPDLPLEGPHYFGAGNINLHTVALPPLAMPTDLKPTLYEVNFTVDIVSGAPGLSPFAGFATWIYDPDIEPPFVFPSITLPDGKTMSVVVPGTPAALQHDTPARFLVYV